MEILSINGATRRMAPPADWDEEKNGRCGTLPIVDTVVDGSPWMSSAWALSIPELAEHAAGAPILLSIRGTSHPVVSIGLGAVPDDAPPRKIAMDLAMEIAQAIEARLQAHMHIAPHKRLIVSPLMHQAEASFIQYATLEDGELVPPAMNAWRVYGPFAKPPSEGGG